MKASLVNKHNHTKIDHNRYASARVVEAQLIEPSLSQQPTTSITRRINEKQIEELKEQKFTRSLAKSLSLTKESFALRIWIIDNSGSMRKRDGNRIQTYPYTYGRVELEPCTRWEEIRQCVNYHIQLAATVQAPTSFRFINTPKISGHYAQKIDLTSPFLVADDKNHNSSISVTVAEAIDIMNKVHPSGVTPLERHINEIRKEIIEMTPSLRANGQQVAIIIATDGLPTDQYGFNDHAQRKSFVDSLRGLEGLPVWVVIRLCTDEEDVVSFYNDLDAVLELSIEVLDDYASEAHEVYLTNPWLNYGLPLHRLREMGYHDRIFDMLDERKLSKGELYDFCVLLFGEDNFYNVPDPYLNWDGFVDRIATLQLREEFQWNPVKHRLKPWISIKKLNQTYNNSRNRLFSPGMITFFNQVRYNMYQA